LHRNIFPEEMTHSMEKTGKLAQSSTNRLQIWHWLIFAGICAFPKLLLIILSEPHVGGDSAVYLAVAENIFGHGCVSMSSPTDGQCIPHWGGNQLPGYPGFIALIWLVFGKSIEAIQYAQTAVFAIATSYLCRNLSLIKSGPFKSFTSLAILALFLGASPSLVGWGRSILTETLSISLSIGMFAELVRSLGLGRLRIFGIALVMILGIFLRYDFVLMLFPIALIGFYLHSPFEAIKRGFCIALILVLPFSLWTYRSVSLGLDYTPPFGLTPDGRALPAGMLKWVGTWLDNQYELSHSVWSLVHFDYENFTPPADAYLDPAEDNTVTRLLSKLRTGSQNEMAPVEIDNEFAEIANEKISQNILSHWLLLPIRRIGSMWLSPFPSMGWPFEVPGATRAKLFSKIGLGEWSEVFQLVLSMPEVFVSKTMIAGHRYILILMTILAIFNWRKFPRNPFVLTAIVLGFAIFRSTVFSFTILIETRYLVPAIAWLDIVLVLNLVRYFSPPTDDEGQNQLW
jgi:hypothetical protein